MMAMKTADKTVIPQGGASGTPIKCVWFVSTYHRAQIPYTTAHAPRTKDSNTSTHLPSVVASISLRGFGGPLSVK